MIIGPREILAWRPPSVLKPCCLGLPLPLAAMVGGEASPEILYVVKPPKL